MPSGRPLVGYIRWETVKNEKRRTGKEEKEGKKAQNYVLFFFFK